MKPTMKLAALALAALMMTTQQAWAAPANGPAADAKPAPKAAPATAADVKAGATLRDVKGAQIGTIASIDGDKVVIDTGKDKVGVPLSVFGKDDKGLMLGITADEFNGAIAKAHAKAQPAAPAAAQK